MADTKISLLTDGATANAADDIPANRAGANVRITPAYIAEYIRTLSQTLTNKTLTTPAINGGTHTAITGLGIRSTGAAFDLTMATAEVLTAGRTLSWVLGDAARTITLGGALTLGGAFITSGASSLTLTTTGATSVTLPTAGTLAILGANIFTGSQQLTSGTTLNWNADTILQRDAANTLAFRNSTTAQTFNVYNTFTDASNYERFAIDWATTANEIRLASTAAGTGTQRSMRFVAPNGGFSFNSGAVSDVFQIQFNQIFCGIDLRIGSTRSLVFSDGTDYNRGFKAVTGQKAIKVSDGSTGGGAIQLQEMTAPTAPASTLCFLYSDTSGGKTRVMARFNTGADVVIATQA